MFNLLQTMMPKKALTRLAGWFARQSWGAMTHFAITRFIRTYTVNMAEAAEPDPGAYPTFNAFFTRALQADARPYDLAPAAVISPVDGLAGQVGRLNQGILLQAKGRHYSLSGLLAKRDSLCESFRDGHYLTAYLAPKDYHRVHCPLAARLDQMIYVPGKFFSVKPVSMQGIDGLFARNERVIMSFTTPVGKMAVIMIGAMIVGSIVTAWHGVVKSAKCDVFEVCYQDNAIELAKGDELGYFQLGSSVVVLFEAGMLDSLDVASDCPLVLGQRIATLATRN